MCVGTAKLQVHPDTTQETLLRALSQFGVVEQLKMAPMHSSLTRCAYATFNDPQAVLRLLASSPLVCLLFLSRLSFHPSSPFLLLRSALPSSLTGSLALLLCPRPTPLSCSMRAEASRSISLRLPKSACLPSQPSCPPFYFTLLSPHLPILSPSSSSPLSRLGHGYFWFDL